MSTSYFARGIAIMERKRACPTTRHVATERWTPDLDRPGYRELPAWQVAPAVVKAVATMIDFACRDLGIEPTTIDVRWYEDNAGADRGFSHWSRPREVWVRTTKDYRGAMRTVAHELRHLAQFREGLKAHGGALRQASEREADDYAGRAMARFL